MEELSKLLRQGLQDRSYGVVDGLNGQVLTRASQRGASGLDWACTSGTGWPQRCAGLVKSGASHLAARRHDVENRQVPVQGQLQETQAKRISVCQPLLATQDVCVWHAKTTDGPYRQEREHEREARVRVREMRNIRERL